MTRAPTTSRLTPLSARGLTQRAQVRRNVGRSRMGQRPISRPCRTIEIFASDPAVGIRGRSRRQSPRVAYWSPSCCPSPAEIDTPDVAPDKQGKDRDGRVGPAAAPSPFPKGEAEWVAGPAPVASYRNATSGYSPVNLT